MSSQQKEDQHASRVTRKKIHMRQMLGESRIAVFSQWFVLPDVPKVASLKRPVRRQLFSRQMKNGTPLWREADFEGKMYKTPRAGTNFGRSDVQKWHAAVAHFHVKKWHEKWHAPVARSTFASQNVQKTSVRDRFWKFRCPKIARRCGAKHICKSECAKHTCLDHFLKVRCPKIARRCGAQHICKSKCTKHLLFAAFWEVSNWLPH